MSGGAQIPAAVKSAASQATGFGAGHVAAPPAPRVPASPTSRSLPNTSSIIERVEHYIRATGGSLSATDVGYRVSFSHGGFGLSVRKPFTPAQMAAQQTQPISGPIQGPTPPTPPSLPSAIPSFRSNPSFRVSVAGATAPWHSHQNVATRRLSRALTERVTALTGRLHWDFVLGRALPGSLRIRAHVFAPGSPRRVTVAHVRGVSGPAIRWSTGGGTDVLMGGFVVRDAHGHVLYRGLPNAAGARLSLTVPARALHGAALPVTVDPTVTTEYPTELPVYIHQTSYQFYPSVSASGQSSSGTNFLVAWYDCRYGCHIWGTRVDTGGRILDPAGIPISLNAPSFQYGPAIAWNGSNKWLVVWTDYRNGNYDIYGSMVDTNGNVLNPNGIAITTATADQYDPAVAFNGSTFLVAWTDTRTFGTTGYDVFAGRVDSNGNVLTTPGTDMVISNSANWEFTPSVAATGSQFLVAWQDSRNYGTSLYDIYAARVNSGGTLLDASGFAITTATNQQTQVSLTSDGSLYFAAWADLRNGTDYDIWGQRITTSGTLSGSAFNMIFYTDGDQLNPSVYWNGSLFVVAEEDGYLRVHGYPSSHDIWDYGVTNTGVITAFSEMSYGDTPGGYVPRVAWNGKNALLVRTNDDFLNQYDIVGNLLAAYGGALTGNILTNYANDQSSNVQPAIAYDPVDNEYLVAWYDDRTQATGTDIYAERIKPDGTLLDGTGIPVSTAYDTQGTPQISWNGSEFLVVWDDYRNGNWDVYGSRVTPGGAVLDRDGIAISTAPFRQGVPTVATDGTNFFVVWQDYRDSNTKSPDIWGARVSPAGTVMDPGGIQISNDAFYDDYPHVAFNGSNYLVVWHSFTNLSGSYTYDIRGQMVSPVGSLVGSTLDISTAVNSQVYAKVASNGDGFLVVWEDYRDNATNSNDIYGQLVAANDTLSGANIPVEVQAPNGQGQPTVAWDGANYLVPFVETRYSATNGWDIYAKRVTSTGTVMDTPDGFAVADSPYSESWPGAVAGPNGQTMVMYGRYAPDTTYGAAFRQFVRFVNVSLPSVPNLINPSAPFQKSKNIGVSWSPSAAGENPLTGYDVAYQVAPYNGAFGPAVNLTSTASTSATLLNAVQGSTYCFMVRSHDSLGYHSNWSTPKCTAEPIDDKKLSAAGSWTHHTGSGNFLNTYSETTSKGASLSKSNVHAKHLALIVTKGPGYGSVKVSIGSKSLGTFSLSAGSVKKEQIITLPALATLTIGTVKIVVTTSGKTVIIDGLGDSQV